MQWNINKKANLKQRITLLTIIALSLIVVTAAYATYTVNKDLTDISGGKENSNYNLTHSASANPVGQFQSTDTIGNMGFLETASCACPGQGQNWQIKTEDNCIIAANCDIGTGTLSFNGTGTITINSVITTQNMIPPEAGTTIYLGPNAVILVKP